MPPPPQGKVTWPECSLPVMGPGNGVPCHFPDSCRGQTGGPVGQWGRRVTVGGRAPVADPRLAAVEMH